MNNSDTSAPKTAKHKNVQRKTRGPEKPKPPKQTYSDAVIAELLKSDSIVVETVCGNLLRFTRTESGWGWDVKLSSGWSDYENKSSLSIRRELRECKQAWAAPITNMEANLA